MDDPVTKCKLCLLCAEGFAYGIDWKYPETGHHQGTMHFTKGKTWEPMKGHPAYELHLRMVKLLEL